jgi:hypothetical protein
LNLGKLAQQEILSASRYAIRKHLIGLRFLPMNFLFALVASEPGTGPEEDL